LRIQNGGGDYFGDDDLKEFATNIVTRFTKLEDIVVWTLGVVDGEYLTRNIKGMEALRQDIDPDVLAIVDEEKGDDAVSGEEKSDDVVADEEKADDAIADTEKVDDGFSTSSGGFWYSLYQRCFVKPS